MLCCSGAHSVERRFAVVYLQNVGIHSNSKRSIWGWKRPPFWKHMGSFLPPMPKVQHLSQPWGTPQMQVGGGKPHLVEPSCSRLKCTLKVTLVGSSSLLLLLYLWYFLIVARFLAVPWTMYSQQRNCGTIQTGRCCVCHGFPKHHWSKLLYCQ